MRKSATTTNPPELANPLQDCGLDSSVDFAEENGEDQQAFHNLGKISIICKNSQSPYLKTSKTAQYEIIPCNELHGYIARENKVPTNHSLPRADDTTEQEPTAETDGDGDVPVQDA